MKRFILFVPVAALFFAKGFAQEKTGERMIVHPPAPVLTAFTKSFPGAAQVKWEKEGVEYEVNFLQSGKRISVVYNSAGKWQENEQVIKISELPAEATAYIRERYKGARIREAAKITKPGGEINYEAAVSGKDLLFDDTGKFKKEEKD